MLKYFFLISLFSQIAFSNTSTWNQFEGCYKVSHWEGIEIEGYEEKTAAVVTFGEDDYVSRVNGHPIKSLAFRIVIVKSATNVFSLYNSLFEELGSFSNDGNNYSYKFAGDITIFEERVFLINNVELNDSQDAIEFTAVGSVNGGSTSKDKFTLVKGKCNFDLLNQASTSRLFSL